MREIIRYCFGFIKSSSISFTLVANKFVQMYIEMIEILLEVRTGSLIGDCIFDNTIGHAVILNCNLFVAIL